MISEFLETLYGGLDGHIDIVTRDPETGALDSERWLTTSDLDFAERYIDLRKDEDVYCSVAVFSGEHRTNSDAQAVTNVVWADADTCAPENFKIYPSIVVTTSPGRYHVWWVLSEPVPAAQAAKVAQKISHAHRDQGCDHGWFVSKILRVPGTHNRKPGYDNPEVTAQYTGEVFALADLDAAYADVPVAAVQVSSEAVPDPVTHEDQIALEDKIAGTPLENLYTERPPEGASWYERLFKFEMELFRLGLTPQEVYTLAANCACNKYKRDNRPDSDLWKDVQKAYSTFGMEDAEAPAVQDSVKFEIPDFLTEQERANLPRTFVDEYTEWVAGNTDAATVYQHSLAFTVLSSVLGNRAYIPTRYSRENLCIWVMVLGGTTWGRKTTAMNQALSLIHGVEMNTGNVVDIGSDATKEGLVKVLGKRDGQVSLIHTDEVNSMFQEIFNKTHMSGVLGFYTELYNGQVPVVHRASKDSGNPTRAKTVFNFLGVGVREEVAKVLTKRDFGSGFLARMLWAVADKPVRAGDIDFLPLDDDAGTADVVRQKMVHRLWTVAKKFDPDKPGRINIPSEVKDRFNRWGNQVMKHAESMGDDILVAATDRLTKNVLKAASLLAMSDGTLKVTLPHLLVAINQAQEWYRDMLRMSREIASSDFERLQDEVEAFIAQGKEGKQSETAVKRKFARLRPQEMGDVLGNLKSQGRIRKNMGKWEVLA